MRQATGAADPRFAPVRDVFDENFAHRGELGAALTVVVDGRTVVDLWGGTTDKHGGRPWTPETLVVVFSCTKAATALCAHMLAARGRLDLDVPVARYWPEFAAADKGDIPVRMLLNHRAGLPAIDRPMPPESLYDWEAMSAALATQPPHWTPGTAHGYHAVTFGFLAGELIRRLSGQTVGAFFREHVAGPLDLDFFIGLPEALEGRVATVRMAPIQAEPSPFTAAMFNRSTLTSKAFLNPRALLMPGQINSRRAHAAEIPAANGIASARGLAGMYAPLACAGSAASVSLIDRETLRAMSTVESDGEDRILLTHTRFASGFMKTMDNRPGDSAILGPNEDAFGHAGAGGSIGFADPVAGVAFGYVMNQLGAGVLLNERGQGLIDAVYDCLGASVA
jgi:CubicO group peptidase (beta-lactamase class C family)